MLNTTDQTMLTKSPHGKIKAIYLIVNSVRYLKGDQK